MKGIAVIRERLRKLRRVNADQRRGVGYVLLVLFPFCLTVATELNQMGDFAELATFLTARPSVALFSILVTTFVFAALLLLLRRGSAAILVTGLLFFGLSCVEYFKYVNSGTHFTFADLAMTTNMSDVAGFADLHFAPHLLLGLVGILVYWLAAVLFPVKLNVRIGASLLSALVTTGLGAFILINPFVASSVYALFDVETAPAANIFSTAEKFEQNNLVAHLAETFTEQVNADVKQPENYSRETITALLGKEEPAQDTFQKPNVIVITSESLGDFRRFSQLAVPEETYTGFDEVAEEGFLGNCIVPTFGGYTVRTEFEMIFGLPFRALSSYKLPQMQLREGEQATFADYYRDLGYTTTYLHPFSSSFYSRGSIYPHYGFDQLLFLQDFGDNAPTFHDYLDDDVIYASIESLLRKTEEPSFIYAMTMQNHVPYNSPDEAISDFEYYLEGVQHSLDGLKALTEALRKLDEPTVLLFLGDHYPFFGVGSDVYETAQIDADNCDVLYQQSYVVWSNYELDYSLMPQGTVSAFYLGHAVTQLIGAPQTDFVSAMLEKMEEVPVYTQTGNRTLPRDEELDALTYDRTKGEQYSYQDEFDSVEPYWTR